MKDDCLNHQSQQMLSRRQVLQVGGIGAMGLSLPGFLRAEKLQKADGPAKSCIFIHQYGGLSQLDSWDMKPDAPQEIRGPYKSIKTATPGFHVCELMPNLAKLSEEYAVIRSMTHTVSEHKKANSMLLAGKDQPAADDPSFGAMVNKLRPSNASIPGHVWLQKFGGGAAPPDYTYLTGGHLGMSYAPMLIGEKHDDNPASPDFRVSAFDAKNDLSAQQQRSRRNLLQDAQSLSVAGDGPEFESFETHQRRAFELLHGKAAKQAFEIEKEDDRVRDRYGRNPLGQNLLLARRLIEAGVRLVNVAAWTGLAPGEKFVSVETWDMHGNAFGIDDGMPILGSAVDKAASAFIEDCSRKGLSEKILLVITGEFGRTPKINARGGRDHWGNLCTLAFAGGGLKMGQVVGKSDKLVGQPAEDLVTANMLLGTVMNVLFDPGQVRLLSSIPDEVKKAVVDSKPIPQLV